MPGTHVSRHSVGPGMYRLHTLSPIQPSQTHAFTQSSSVSCPKNTKIFLAKSHRDQWFQMMDFHLKAGERQRFVFFSVSICSPGNPLGIESFIRLCHQPPECLDTRTIGYVAWSTRLSHSRSNNSFVC